jgi:putative ATP-dependent endonuclease of the OLD family
MKRQIEKIEFINVRNFRSTSFDFPKDMIIVGQNDHGKSAIFKLLDVVFNRLKSEYINQEKALPEEIFKICDPALPVKNKAKRINLYFKGVPRPLSITFKEGLVSISYNIKNRTEKSQDKAREDFIDTINSISFIHIPAARDACSPEYLRLFQEMLKARGLSEIIPKVSGGTRKEYRALMKLRGQLADTIKPFLDQNVLPRIKDNLLFQLPYDLNISFQITMMNLIAWIEEGLNLGVKIDRHANLIPISQVGSGIQSLLMLAIQRVLTLSDKDLNKTYILAIEEPESFLHPQAQRNIADYLSREMPQKENIYLMISTHSPYILNYFNLSKILLVRKESHYSRIYTPILKEADSEVLNDFNNEINSEIFFANAVLFVEGESDKRVLYKIINNLYGFLRGDITIICAGGNKSFSPYLRLISTLNRAQIPWGILTDFDSLMKEGGERALFRGLQDADIKIDQRHKNEIAQLVDSVLDKDEVDYLRCTQKISEILEEYRLKVFIFPSDLEWELCTDGLKGDVVEILRIYQEIDATGLSLIQLRKKLGSKGIPISGDSNKDNKKPYLHEKIAAKINKSNISPTMLELGKFIKNLIDLSPQKSAESQLIFGDLARIKHYKTTNNSEASTSERK